MSVRLVAIGCLFAAGVAAGRWTPPSSPPDARRPAADAKQEASPSATPSDVRARNAPRVVPLRRAARAPSPWIEHVSRDPTHHAGDAHRISQAVFGNAAIVEDLERCAPLFGPIESRLRLRTRVDITPGAIEIGPVEDVEVWEGELTSAARACVLAAFARPTATTPAHPDRVQPYHGPYELLASVVGHSNQQPEETEE